MALHRRLAGFFLLLACGPFAVAQPGSASGRLQVTATIVSSSLWIEQPDGSFRLVVANAFGGQDVTNLQLAVNRPTSAQAVSPDVVAVSLVSPGKTSGRKRVHRR